MSLDDLKASIAAKLDVDEFLDVLGYELIDILDKFDDEIEENRVAYQEACRN